MGTFCKNSNREMSKYERPTGRVRSIFFGGLLLLFSLPCAVGLFIVAINEYDKITLTQKSLLTILIFLAATILIVTAIILGVRLLFNIPRHEGGLISVWGLRLGGVVLIALPIASFLSDSYKDLPGGTVSAIMQGVLYFGCGVGAFSLAKKRQSRLKEMKEKKNKDAEQAHAPIAASRRR